LRERDRHGKNPLRMAAHDVLRLLWNAYQKPAGVAPGPAKETSMHHIVRACSFVAGCAVAAVGALLGMFAAAAPGASAGGWIGAILLAVLAASGFLYIGVFGVPARWSRRRRWIAGVLLLFPMLLSVYMMFLSGHPEWQRVLVPVPIAALLLASLAVWPAWCFRARAGK
jgi:hypothetical protein